MPPAEQESWTAVEVVAAVQLMPEFKLLTLAAVRLLGQRTVLWLKT